MSGLKLRPPKAGLTGAKAAARTPVRRSNGKTRSRPKGRRYIVKRGYDCKSRQDAGGTKTVRAGRAHCNITPTMEADIRLAMVPQSMARMPSWARSERLLGASAPMPPI